MPWEWMTAPKKGGRGGGREGGEEGGVGVMLVVHAFGGSFQSFPCGSD